MQNYMTLARQALSGEPLPQNTIVSLDSVGGDSDGDYGDFDAKNTALHAAALVQTWVETDDLDDGETLSDRLFAMIMGQVDEDKDGEVSEEEQEMFDEYAEYAGQYMMRHGADKDDVEAAIYDADEEAAERVRDVNASNLPDGEDAAHDINDFVFGSAETMDSVVLDKAFQTPNGHVQVTRGKNKAGYKTVVVIRHGQRAIARKRIAGHVRLTEAQKTSIAEARKLSKTPEAKRKWRKSMKLRKKLGVRNLKRK